MVPTRLKTPHTLFPQPPPPPLTNQRYSLRHFKTSLLLLFSFFSFYWVLFTTFLLNDYCTRRNAAASSRPCRSHLGFSYRYLPYLPTTTRTSFITISLDFLLYHLLHLEYTFLRHSSSLVVTIDPWQLFSYTVLPHLTFNSHPPLYKHRSYLLLHWTAGDRGELQCTNTVGVGYF